MSENTAVVAENKPKGKFLNNDKRAFRAILWGILAPVIAVIGVIVLFVLIFVGVGVSAGGGNSSAAVAVSIFALVLVLGLVAVGISSVVFYMMWVYRAHKNAETIAGEELFLSAGWNVGFHFIPLANLVVPYLLMLRIAEKSADQTSKTLVLTWWISLAASFVLSFGGLFASLSTLPALINASSGASSVVPVDSTGAILAGNGLSALSNLASFVGFVVSFFVINAVTKAQKQRADELGLLTVEDKLEA